MLRTKAGGRGKRGAVEWERIIHVERNTPVTGPEAREHVQYWRN